MTRSTLSSTNRTETQKKEVRQVEFAEFAFPSGTIRVCNADRNMTWGGFTWLADATLIEPASAEEVADLSPRRYAFLLSALGTLNWAVEAGTAQAGSNNTLTLRAGADARDDYFNGKVLRLLSGTGSVQEQPILDYNGATKVATVPQNWLATYLLMTAASGQRASTPDSAAASVTGDIDLRCEAACDDWNAPGRNTFIAKYGSGGNSYGLTTNGSNFLVTVVVGGVDQNYQLAIPASFIDGQRRWIRATVDLNNGANSVATFYESADGVSWTQIGSPITGAIHASITDGGAPVTVGALASNALITAGKIYSAEVRNGIDGPIAVSFNAADGRSGATSVVSSETGETWSVLGTAALAPAPDATTTYDVQGPLVHVLLTENYQFALVKFYVGWCDSTWALVADPHVLGDTLLMSNAVLSLDEAAGTIELSAESWTIFSERDSAVLATPQSQRLRYPGDSGQDRMAQIVTQIVEWNGQPQRVGAVPGTRVDGLVEYRDRQ